MSHSTAQHAHRGVTASRPRRSDQIRSDYKLASDSVVACCQVVAVEFQAAAAVSNAKPHEVVLEAARDNKDKAFSEQLPLSPWN
jgi:hypothetical protein